MATRADHFGMFWHDEVKVKATPKEVIKRTPPPRTWEEPGFLPDNISEAYSFKPTMFNDMELWQAHLNKEPLVFDVECYPNYVLFLFRGVYSKKAIAFILDDAHSIDHTKLLWVLQSFCLIHFNGIRYDMIIAALAVAGASEEDMWLATHMIIEQRMRAKEIYKKFKVKKIQNIDQIDLIELAALDASLKVCAGRLHAQRMQDLPFKPGSYLTEDQKLVTFMYCFNDLDNTELLYADLQPQINLRIEIGKRFCIDIRSRSDAQMAEDIIGSEIKRITGQKRLELMTLPEGACYRFKVPNFIEYQSDLMNHVLNLVKHSVFHINGGEFGDGTVVMPPQLKDLVIEIHNCKYKMGIGGLHSQESTVSHIADEDYFIADTDATSYYPRLMLNAGLTPANLGRNFLLVYDGIVVERISAKHAGDIITAECLKIVVNGSFGKLGSRWSIMYAPDLMIQVTITGQLSLLMLIERFELAGIEVLSANTDGVVVKCLRTMEATFNAIVKQWEKDTGFETEEVRYKATYSKDVNNYIAVYETPQKGKLYKAKGAYGPTSPKKNAVNEICIQAALAQVLHNTPIAETITACKKVSMFTTMRRVTGGAVKDGVYLGKIIRWYYATEAQGEIISAKSGNKVARSDGAKPCMDLPVDFPTDINYDWYTEETAKILTDIGYLTEV